MSRLDHEQVMRVLAEAIELPASRRGAFLDSTCTGEPELRQELEQLLECAEGASVAFDIAAERIVQPDPERIGPYELLEPIGEGGMAIVYKAQQHQPVRRLVAIKLIKLGMDTRQFVARFEAERQALAMMDHPNVAQVYDAGATDTGRPYFVIEHVPGQSILSWCDARKLTVRQRLELFIPVCEAVEHAHRKGIIHRDLKSSNVLVTEVDGHAIPKVIDFGVAKAISQRLTDRTMFTEQGQLIGTPAYMSPEQAERGALDIDTRTDVYSLGVLLYELITGVPPIPSDLWSTGSYEQVQRIIRDTEPARPSTRLGTLIGDDAIRLASERRTALPTLIRELRSELEWIPLKAMRKDREQRYRSASELADDIHNYLQHRPLLAGPESGWYRTRKFLHRHKAAVAALAVMVLLLVGGIAATSWQAVRATRAETETRAALRASEDSAIGMQAVNDFLTGDVLGSSSPIVTRGKPLSVGEALDSAARTIGGRFNDRPATKSAIHRTLAGAYRELSRFDEALIHARAALDLCTASLKPDDRETLRALGELGMLFRDQGKLEEAGSLLSTAVERARITYGSADEMTRNLIGCLGSVRLAQGRLKEAEHLCREALDVARSRHGDEHESTVDAMNNLAMVLRYEGDFAGAEVLLRTAVQSAKRLLGDDHPSIVLSMNTLGAVLQAQGKLQEAETTKREVVRLSRQVFGEEHFYTINHLNSLADALQQRGNEDEAVPLFREALDRARRVLGPDHHVTLAITNNFAKVLDNQGKWDEAEPLYRQTAELGRQARGVDHPDVIVSILNYARALARHGQLDAAEAQAAEVLPVARRKLGDDHRFTRALMQEYGRILNMKGKPAAAEALLRESLERGRRILPPDSPDIISSLKAMAEFLMEHKRYSEAEPLAAEVYRVSVSAQMSPRNAASNMLLWGLCLHGLGEFSRAEPPLTEVHRRMSEAGMAAEQMHVVLTALASVCDQTSRPEEAAKWRAELAGLQASNRVTSNPAAGR